MKEGPEITLRRIWSGQGMPTAEQDRMIAEIEYKASDGYRRNVFKLIEKRTGKTES